MNKNKASGVSWVKPAEPSFLKKFKNDVGYREGPTVDTKRQVMPELDDSGSDREDELPQVVVPKGEDLTEEDLKKIKGKICTKSDSEKDSGPPPDGKIIFKKPTKRSSSDKFQGITASSSKKKKNVEGEIEKKEVRPGKKVKNSSLLSFGGDDDREED